MNSIIPKPGALRLLAAQNWKAALTVALISVPLSIAISIASGAGPVPGVITGIWATIIASLFGGSNYNIIGAAGALTTVLFAATLAAPAGLGADVLPLLALASGAIILMLWAIGATRFLYYIPSSVMYGFSAGVAFLIAASQLFDATGLSTLKRTGTFLGDIALYAAHAAETHLPSLIVFAVFITFILVWKRFVKAIPAVIPASLLGITLGWASSSFFDLGLISLGDKFGSFTGMLSVPVAWHAIPALIGNSEALMWVLEAAGLIALIAVLETLITAKIADKITRTQSSSQRELFGLALANLGSGVAGGLPATGVFIRTGANIKAGATHRMSAFLAALFTAVIALVALPFFTYIPMVVIAAILVNTAIGLIEVEKIKEFWHYEKPSLIILILVAIVTVLHDAGTAVGIGAILALLLFADNVSRGKFDAIFNFDDGTKEDVRGAKVLTVPKDKHVAVATYSIAGSLGYIDSARHAANFRHLAHAHNVDTVIIRLRDLFSIDFEGQEMLAEAAAELHASGKRVCISSANAAITETLQHNEAITQYITTDDFFNKTSDALNALGIRYVPQKTTV